jgi:hypothetical protein
MIPTHIPTRFGDFELIDLILNLVSEAIGLIVGLIATYLIIDRLLKKRERAQWAPSKKIVYAKLFNPIDDFLDTFLGDGFRLNNGQYVYMYGIASIFGGAPYKKINKYEISKHVEFKIKAELIGGGAFNRTRLEEMLSKINTIVDTYSLLIEPELMSLLLELDNEVLTLSSMGEDILKDPFDLSLFLSNIVEKASVARIYLEGKADKCLSSSEYRKEIIHA